MSDLDHLAALEIRHKELDKQCKEGYTNFLADADLKKMKMQKAMVKGQIEEIKRKIT
jgi:hypothetical protein